MTKKLLILFALIAAVSASVIAYQRSAAADDQPVYQTAPVTRGSVVDVVQATGTLQAVTTVQVGTQVSGTIQALYADFNSKVRKGEVVAKLDPSLLQTQVDQAKASLDRLQADVARARVDVDDTQTKLQRAHELWNQQLIAKTDLDTADTAARQAQASLKSAQAQVVQAQASLNQNEVNLGHTIIRAPIDGIVISRNVDVGQTVAASMSAPTLFVIAKDLREMQVNAQVDESDIGRIEAGEAVTFKVDAYPDEVFTGKVSQVRLQPTTESNVVSYMTIIDVPNPRLQLKPGMTANVSVEVARADDTLRVPVAALRFKPAGIGTEAGRAVRAEAATGTRGAAGGSTRTASGGGHARVFVLQDGALQPVPVSTGVSDGITVAVTSPRLDADEMVVTGVTGPSVEASGNSASPLIPFGRGRRSNNSQRTTGQGAR